MYRFYQTKVLNLFVHVSISYQFILPFLSKVYFQIFVSVTVKETEA
jgi:hypothetical protein